MSFCCKGLFKMKKLARLGLGLIKKIISMERAYLRGTYTREEGNSNLRYLISESKFFCLLYFLRCSLTFVASLMNQSIAVYFNLLHMLSR